MLSLNHRADRRLNAKSRATEGELDALARRSAGSNGFGAPEAAAPQPTYKEYRTVIRRLVAFIGLK